MSGENEGEKPVKSWKRFARLKPNRKLLRRSARKIETATLKHAHRFIIRRLDNARDVRRHALSWLALMILLIGLSVLHLTMYQGAFSKIAPVSGGTYAEGVIGALDTMNPLFASTSAERAASKLLFASLLSYDRENKLRGELAETWTSGDDGKTFTVTLRDHLKWHDGEPLTVDDVIYTIGLMKNPRINVALYRSWADITATKISDRQINFTLPASYAPFPHALTFGVVPKHILAQVPIERMRENSFNREPVGSGPFAFRNLQIINQDASRLVVYMTAFDNYVFGKPKLDRFQLHTYKDQSQLKHGFLTDEINAAADLTSNDLSSIAATKSDAVVSKALVDNGVFALFRNDSPILKDQTVRAALQQATDRPEILRKLHGYGRLMEGPLTRDQLPAVSRQAAFDRQAAAQRLEAAGWSLAGGVRQKAGVPLTLNVVAPKSGDYQTVVDALAQQWRQIGVDVKVDLASPATIQQNVLVPRNYDVLIYELAIGADPDVFAYWHSSQIGSLGFNLANYSSAVSDDALSSARGRLDSTLRTAKYEAFTQQWLKDVPAIALYQPRLHYVADETTRTLTSQTAISDATGRYRAVEYWTVNRDRVNNTP